MYIYANWGTLPEFSPNCTTLEHNSQIWVFLMSLLEKPMHTTKAMAASITTLILSMPVLASQSVHTCIS